ncbi:hypothetical protein DAA61_15875 [Bradyrhizobium sp. WBAH33]|nr:hypothetical protein DAA61_15875 [Bradyrhizobium sp. WBAH33]QCK04575.1 hypothetical protein DAB18_15905 [Bradyrhizobium sp. WBAH41]
MPQSAKIACASHSSASLLRVAAIGLTSGEQVRSLAQSFRGDSKSQWRRDPAHLSGTISMLGLVAQMGMESPDNRPAVDDLVG